MTNAERHPSGQVVRHHEDVRGVVLLQRVRARIRRGIDREIAGYPLGQLFAADRITFDELVAGERWATRTARLMEINGLAPPRCRAAQMERIGGKNLSPDVDTDTLDALRHYAVVADCVIGRAGGARGHRIMRSVVLNLEQPEEVPLLKKILFGLASLVSGRKQS